MTIPLKDRVIIIKGAGEQATGIACRLYRANFKRILIRNRLFIVHCRRICRFIALP